MSPESVMDIFGEAMTIIMLMVSAFIIPGLLVGLMVAVFQAATQINEQTLSFLPKLLITFLALLILGPPLMVKLHDFTTTLFLNLPNLVG